MGLERLEPLSTAGNLTEPLLSPLINLRRKNEGRGGERRKKNRRAPPQV